MVHCDVPVVEDARGARDEEEVCGIIHFTFASVFLPIGGIFVYLAFTNVDKFGGGNVNRIVSLIFGTLLVHRMILRLFFTYFASLHALLW